MTSATAERIAAQEQGNLSASSINELSGGICSRCGGLLVKHVCMDLQNSASELDITTKRCVQCGDVVDPVIMRNRRLRQESSSTYQAETPIVSQQIVLAA